MAVADRLQSLSDKWQVPLLVVSAAMFVAGLLQLRPSVPVITFQERIESVRALQQAKQFARASDVLTSLLAEPDLSAANRAAVHRLLAETIWLAESEAGRHTPENARRILKNLALAKELGSPMSGPDRLKAAEASAWLDDKAGAIEHYRAALKLGGVDRVNVLRHLLELLLAQRERYWPEIDACMDQLVEEAANQPEALVQALQWKIQRLLLQEQIEQARDLLESKASCLDVPPWSEHLRYLRAMVLFHEGRLTEAEARLRALQAGVRRSDPLYARAGWLLGRINYIEQRPQVALAFYNEVVRTHVGSEYWVASLIGKAEALAALQRYAAAADAYQVAIEALRRFQGSLLIDAVAIREALRSLAVMLSQTERPDEALLFAQTAVKIAEGGPEETVASLLELQGRIHLQAAESYWRRAKQGAATGEPGGPAAASQPLREELEAKAREHFIAAGEKFLRLAKMRVMQDDLADEAGWQAARAFDKAGQIDRAVETLQAYIQERPLSEHAPEAMYRLAQALQALGRWNEAIRWYEDLLARFGRTPSAFASLVPLARCYQALGPKRYGDAEKILLSVVEEDPSRPPLFSPAAPEFREALFELANLYIRWDRPERAIERLEQALALYPEDPRGTRMRYLLADAYRRSGLALQSEAAKIAQPAQADQVRREAQRRLGRAWQLFDEVVTALEAATSERSPTEQAYLKSSAVYRADCAFDLGRYGEAARLYGQVAWRWQNDPVALSAYVQIVRCHLAAGDLAAARTALVRARWLLKKIPDSALGQPPDARDRAYWVRLFDWIERSGLLAAKEQMASASGAK